MEDQNSLSESIVPSRAQPQILQEESMSKSPRRRVLMQLGALTAAATLCVLCPSNDARRDSEGGRNDAPAPLAASDNHETGDIVTIGFVIIRGGTRCGGVVSTAVTLRGRLI